MDTLEQINTRADELYHDIDFQTVRDWKAEVEGRHVIGHMPIYVPCELIHAGGMLPVGLHGGGSQVEIIRGDAYFQSYICQLPRSTIELALSGRLDAFDGFLFPAICDVIRNLSGMWQMLFPDRYIKYLDVPQNFDSEIGGRFYAHELQTIRQDFERLLGHPITDDALRASITAYNVHRGLIDEIMELRRKTPWRVPAYESYLVIRAGDRLTVEAHTEMLRAYIEGVNAADRPMRDHSRIVITGSFCEQPPLGLIRTLERAGCYIVWDDMTLGSRWLNAPVSTEGDPINALSHAFIKHSCDNASKYDEVGCKGQWLCETVDRCGAEGVIFAAPSFCDPALLEQPMLQNVLDEEGIPWTAFKYSESLGQFQVIREQAGTFADSIRLWGE